MPDWNPGATFVVAWLVCVIAFAAVATRWFERNNR